MNTVIWCITGLALLAGIVFFRRAGLWILKSVVRGLLGMAVIFAVNSCIPGMNVGINLYTAVISSVLGLPGTGMLFIISKLI